MRSRWRIVGPALAVVVAATVGLVLAARPGPEPADAVEPTSVSSDAPRLRSLEELVESADVVVRAEVVATERGRVFGEPGGTSIQSRLVTLQVADVLAGATPPAGRLLVEEEGWLADGTPLVVDGASASATGDDGIWFLAEVGDPDVPAYVVLSAEGRYLVAADGLRGAEGDDPLIAALAALSVDELTRRITALPP